MKHTDKDHTEDVKVLKVAKPVSPIASKKTKDVSGKTDVPSWGPIVGVVYSLLLAFIGGSALAALAVSFILTAFGMSKSSINDWYASPWGALIYSIVTAVFAVGAIALYVSKSRSTWRSLGIIRPSWRHIGTAVAAVFVYMALYIVIISIVKALLPAINIEQQQDLGINNPQGLCSMLLVFVTLVIIPPIVEETIFRGFMYAGLRTKLPFIVAALITSALFALGHLQFGSSAPLLWVAAIDTFVLSMVMCYVRERTGSIIPTMIMHALKNLLAFSFLYIFVS